MIDYCDLNELRLEIRKKKDDIADKRDKRIKNNPYYYGRLLNSLRYIIPSESRVLNLGCGTGYILNELKPACGVGVESSSAQIAIACQNYPDLTFYDQELEMVKVDGVFDYILLTGVEDIIDLKAVLDAVRPNCDRHTRIIVSYYSFLWQPLVTLAEKLHLRIPQRVHNWFSANDINNLLEHSGYDLINTKTLILFPYYIPLLSGLLERIIARLPFFRQLTMSRIAVARAIFLHKDEYTVSVIIPCRNEEGNIQSAVERMPSLGTHTEIIFCDDKSTDDTAGKVREMINKYPEKDIKLLPGPGICKADNVWTGFDHASGDILLILDADLTVIPEELHYFYEAIARGRGEFINGSRLVYPMHDEAMRPLNMLGNKFFSIMFSYILDNSIKDTLCGTKVLWRDDFYNIKKLRNSWGIKDRWGDYELIFGAAKTHRKIIDLPVHYMERTYGETKMTNRMKNGWIMLRMSFLSLFKIKFH